MKERYETPEMKINAFIKTDIVTASNGDVTLPEVSMEVETN